jgi:hypothetical protein
MECQDFSFSDLPNFLIAPIYTALKLFPWIISSVTQSNSDNAEILTFNIQDLPPPPTHRKPQPAPPPQPPPTSIRTIHERRGI